ncbi:MAG: DUF4199 domain-containing protein [Bacteroidota bacterium]
MKNTILRFGLYGGITLLVLNLFAWFVLSDTLDYRSSEVVGYISMLIALSPVFLGIKYYRDNELDGVIGFGKAFRLGLAIALVPALFMFAYAAIFFQLWGDEFAAWAEESFKNGPPEAYEQYLAQMEALGPIMESPFLQGALMFVTVFLVGFIVALISAVVLQRKSTSLVAV